MTVLVRSETVTDPQHPAWLTPPPEGFTAEDLDHFPDLPAHTELLDGSLVFVSPQRDFHSITVDLLVTALRLAAPREFRVRREMGLVLGPRQRPEPDVVVLHTSAVTERDATSYPATDALLVIEVVSPDSEIRDHERKPQLYAEAGIPHFWLVEQQRDLPTVFVYALDPTVRKYVIASVQRGTLKVDLPFPIEIDLNDIDKL